MSASALTPEVHAGDRVGHRLDALLLDPTLPPQLGRVVHVAWPTSALVQFDREPTTRVVNPRQLRRVPADQEAQALVDALQIVAKWPAGCRCRFAVHTPPGGQPRAVLIWDNCRVHPDPGKRTR